MKSCMTTARSVDRSQSAEIMDSTGDSGQDSGQDSG